MPRDSGSKSNSQETQNSEGSYETSSQNDDGSNSSFTENDGQTSSQSVNSVQHRSASDHGELQQIQERNKQVSNEKQSFEDVLQVEANKMASLRADLPEKVQNEIRKEDFRQNVYLDIISKIYQFQLEEGRLALNPEDLVQQQQQNSMQQSRSQYMQRLLNRLSSSKIYKEDEEEAETSEKELLDYRQYHKAVRGEETEEGEDGGRIEGKNGGKHKGNKGNDQNAELELEDLELSASSPSGSIPRPSNAAAAADDDDDEFQEPMRKSKIQAHTLIKITENELKKLKKSCELTNSSIFNHSTYVTDNKFRKSLSTYRASMMKRISNTEDVK